MMQAYAEGWELLEKVDIVDNVTEVFASWREGTVIRSWLLDLLVAALEDDPHLDKIRGYAEDSGEGRWTVEAAIEQRRTDAGDRRLAVRPVRLPPGRQPGDEGDRGDAQPVRRPRRADRAAARRRRHRRLADAAARAAVRRAPDPARLPLLRRRRRRARAGGRRRSSAATGRARPTWSRRSTTSPGSPRTGSRPTRRWSAPAPTRRWSAPPWSATGGPRCSRSSSTPGSQPRPGQPVAAAPRPGAVGLVRTVVFSPEDLTLVKGDPSDRRRFLDDLLVLRTPRLAGVRADYDRVLRQRNSLLKTAGSPRRGRARRGLARCPPWPCGTTTSPGPARSCSPSGCGWSRSCGRYVGKAYETVARGAPARRRRDRYKRRRFERPAAEAEPSLDRGTGSTDGAARRGRAAPQRRAGPWDLPGRSAPRRSRAHAGHRRVRLPVKGYASPRRVLVVRAGAQAGVVRPAPLRRATTRS